MEYLLSQIEEGGHMPSLTKANFTPDTGRILEEYWRIRRMLYEAVILESLSDSQRTQI